MTEDQRPNEGRRSVRHSARSSRGEKKSRRVDCQDTRLWRTERAARAHAVLLRDLPCSVRVVSDTRSAMEPDDRLLPVMMEPEDRLRPVIPPSHPSPPAVPRQRRPSIDKSAFVTPRPANHAFLRHVRTGERRFYSTLLYETVLVPEWRVNFKIRRAAQTLCCNAV